MQDPLSALGFPAKVENSEVEAFFRDASSGAAKWNSFFGRHCNGPWNTEVVYFDHEAAEVDTLDAHAWRSLVDSAPEATAAWLRHGMRFEEYASPVQRTVIVLTFAALSKPHWHELVRAELEAARPTKDETDDFDDWESNQEYLDHDTGYDTCLADWQASPSALIALLTRITDDYLDIHGSFASVGDYSSTSPLFSFLLNSLLVRPNSLRFFAFALPYDVELGICYEWSDGEFSPRYHVEDPLEDFRATRLAHKIHDDDIRTWKEFLDYKDVGRAKALFKAAVVLLCMHTRAAKSANHPKRKRERGEFDLHKRARACVTGGV